MLYSKNNVVACEPFEVKQATAGKGLAFVTKNAEVIPLQVCFPTDPADTGIQVSTDDVVYVKAESHRTAWAKDRYRFVGSVGSDFILVPLAEIVFIDRGAKKVN
jgi:hypothetical protein